MRLKFIRVSVLTLAVSLAQSSGALACCHAAHKGDWLVKVTEKLHLNADQKAKVAQYAHKAKMELSANRHDMHAVCKQINETFRSGKMNSAKLDTLADKETHLLGTVIRIKLQERYDIYQILDAKQKEKMDMIIAKWEGKHHQNQHKQHHRHHSS